MSHDDDLKQLLLAKTQCHEYAFEACRTFIRSGDPPPEYTGHTTLLAALVYTITSYQKDIDSLVDAYAKKYPD